MEENKKDFGELLDNNENVELFESEGEKSENELDSFGLDSLGSEDSDEITFDESDFKEGNLFDKNSESPEDIENRKRFIKSLSPAYKAEMVFNAMQKQEGARLIVGHEKRVYLRKLEREAKKGRLDKYFLPR